MESMQQILPSGGLASFHNEVSKLADLGRYEDAYIVHAAEGETVVPMEVFDENPGLKEMLFAQMREMGIKPERYIVGNQFNSINPITGQPEFFLKKIFKEAKKALKKVAPYAGMIAGVAGLGPGYSALIGAGAPLLAGQGAGEALMGGIGGYGAGKAFGTADYAKSAFGGKGLPGVDMLGGTDNPYIFSKASRDAGIFKTLGSNLGFGGNDVQLSKDAIENSREFSAYKLKIGDGATVDGFIDATDVDSLAKIGSETASKMTGGDVVTTMAVLAPIYQALKAEEGDKETTEMKDIAGMYPWYGQFADTMAIDPITGQPINYGAEGGIVQHFQDGPGEYGVTAPGQFGVIYPEGDTDFDASEVINQPGDEDIRDLDLFMGDDMAMDERADEEGIMMAMNTQEMITVFDKETGNIVTITRAEFLANPSRYAARPQQEVGDRGQAGTKEDSLVQDLRERMRGIPSDFDVENLKQTIPMLGGAGVMGAGAGAFAEGGIAHLAEGSFPRRTGAIAGPGGPKDDRGPAMLSDGEFVMTAKAVRNAGGGSRRAGAKKMYNLMNRLEGTA